MPKNSLATLGYATKNSIASGGFANQVMADPPTPPTGTMVTHVISDTVNLSSTFSATSRTTRTLTDYVDLSSIFSQSVKMMRSLAVQLNLTVDITAHKNMTSVSAISVLKTIQANLTLSSVGVSRGTAVSRSIASTLNLIGGVSRITRAKYITIPDIILNISPGIAKTQQVIRQITSKTLRFLVTVKKRTSTSLSSSILRHDNVVFSNRNSSKSKFSDRNSTKSKFSDRNTANTKFFKELEL